MLNHRHIIVSASGLSLPPRKPIEVENWLSRLVEKVEMKTLMGPYSIRCDTLGNEGVTGVVCIETSHASIHIWDSVSVPFLKMDLYSCQYFEASDVMEMIREFGPIDDNYMIIDRNDSKNYPPKVIETGFSTLLLSGERLQKIQHY